MSVNVLIQGSMTQLNGSTDSELLPCKLYP
jgi:hypothetical protein